MHAAKLGAITKYTRYIEEWKAGKQDGMRGKSAISHHIKRYLKERAGAQCERCGWNETNPHTGNIPLEIHHIDGNYRNNREDNLELLCPNCHSLTASYKSRGRGRK